MPQIIFIDHAGMCRIVEAASGQSVMEAAVNASITEILGDCGGSLSCGTCHAYVDPDWYDRLPAPSQDEKDMLECTLAPRGNSRLAASFSYRTRPTG